MRHATMTLLSVIVLAATTPFAHAEKKLDRADIRLSVPDTWIEASDTAAAALKATVGTGGQVDASTLSYSHPAKVPLVLGVFIRSKQSAGEDTRQELADFQASMKKALEKGGATFTKFEVTESATRLTSAFEVQQGKIRMLGKAIAAVQADGKLLGWSVECIYTEDHPLDAQLCAGVLATFEVVHPDKDLRPLKN